MADQMRLEGPQGFSEPMYEGVRGLRPQNAV